MKIAIDGVPVEKHLDTGIGIYTYELIKHMIMTNDDKYKFYIITSNKESLSDLKNLAKKNKSNTKFITITEQNSIINKDITKTSDQIIKFIKDEKIDIYHMPRNAMPYPRVKACKYVITIHDLIPMVMPENVRYKPLKCFLYHVPYAIYDSDSIITVSNYSKEDILKYFKVAPSKINAIHIAPTRSISTIKCDNEEKLLKDKYHIDSPYILYVGGLNRRKNVERLIRAIKLLKNKNKLDNKIKLQIAGKIMASSKYVVDLIKELDVEDEVKLIGKVDDKDMSILYKNALIFVYPSLYEGFGLPPLEAMLCHKLVISSNSTSLREVLDKYVIYIDPTNIEDIALKLEPYVSDYEKGVIKVEEKIKKLEEEGIEEFLSKYNFKKTWEKTLEVYDKVYEKSKW